MTDCESVVWTVAETEADPQPVTKQEDGGDRPAGKVCALCGDAFSTTEQFTVCYSYKFMCYTQIFLL